MRRIDRYVLSVLIPAAAVSIVTLGALFLLVDFVERRRHFARMEEPLSFALHYYGVRLPVIVLTVLPVVPLVAGAFVLVKMARANEIVPVLVGGRSMRRLVAPIFALAAAAGAGMAALEEWMLPPLAPMLAHTEARLKARDRSEIILETDGANHFYAVEYDHAAQEMRRYVQWLHMGPGGEVRWRGRAQRAVWDQAGGGWRLFDGWVTGFEGGGMRTLPGAGRPEVMEIAIPPEGYLVPSTLRPYMIQRGGIVARRHVPFAQALADARRWPEIPFHWVRLWIKIAFPWAPILLVGAGLPLVAGPERRSFMRGITLAVLLGAVYVGMVLMGEDLANRHLVSPWVGVVGPGLVFGALAVVQLARMQT